MLLLKTEAMQNLRGQLTVPILEAATGRPLLETHHEVCGRTRVVMSEVDGVHTEGPLQLVLVLDPVGFQVGISGLRCL